MCPWQTESHILLRHDRRLPQAVGQDPCALRAALPPAPEERCNGSASALALSPETVYAAGLRNFVKERVTAEDVAHGQPLTATVRDGVNMLPCTPSLDTLTLLLLLAVLPRHPSLRTAARRRRLCTTCHTTISLDCYIVTPTSTEARRTRWPTRHAWGDHGAVPDQG